MIARICEWYASRFSPERVRTFVGADGDPYLSKYPIFNFGKHVGRAYLHHFHRSDEDAELHNHPWKFAFSIILSGGYDEERRVGDVVRRRVFRPITINWMIGEVFHRVDLLESDAWSIFVSGPIVQSWGFWDRVSGRFTPWKEFIAAKGLTPL